MATNLQMLTSSYDIRRFVACDSMNADILAGNAARLWLLIAVSRDVGERWNCLPDLWRGTRGERGLFIGNFMIYQDRIETGFYSLFHYFW